MLLAEVNGRSSGTQFALKSGKLRRVEVAGEIISDEPVNAVEIIVNGEMAQLFTPVSRKNREGANAARFSRTVEINGSSWIAVRCWEPRPGGRIRFAHTAPWFFDIPGAPLRPRQDDVELLIRSVRQEIARSSGVVPAEVLAEYEKALRIYENIARDAR
jgi:hypothetical protein